VISFRRPHELRTLRPAIIGGRDILGGSIVPNRAFIVIGDVSSALSSSRTGKVAWRAIRYRLLLKCGIDSAAISSTVKDNCHSFVSCFFRKLSESLYSDHATLGIATQNEFRLWACLQLLVNAFYNVCNTSGRS
jgi:hypothetical protein